jgi:ketosteroid isomerase-like protein
MQNPNWVIELFKSIDIMDSKKFASFLADDCEFTFGNADAVKGRDNVEAAVEGFFASIKAISHNDIETWEAENVTISRGIVTYTRQNGTQLTVDYCNIFRMQGSLIKKYNIYVDISQLYT